MDILILTCTHAADGKDIHLLVARVCGEDHFPMLFTLTEQDRCERFTIDTSWNLAARKVDESG